MNPSRQESELRETAFQNVIDLLRYDWVRSFILPSQDTDYPAQLRYAIAQPCAAMGYINIKTIPVEKDVDRQCMCDETMNMLFAPSFTNGQLTTGFQIVERVKTLYPLYMNNPRYVCRTVRDDEKGVFLGVAEHADLDLTEIQCTAQVSPGCRNKAYLLVNSKTFRRAVSSLRDGFDAERFGSALLHSFVSVEMRECPTCGAGSVATCSCKLALTRKIHPLDHVNEIKNLATYIGGYEGFGSLRLYEPGQEPYIGSFTSWCDIRAMVDAERKEALSFWAMKDATKSHAINLLKLTMTEMSHRSPRSASRRETDNGGDETAADSFESSESRRNRYKLLLGCGPDEHVTFLDDWGGGDLIQEDRYAQAAGIMVELDLTDTTTGGPSPDRYVNILPAPAKENVEAQREREYKKGADAARWKEERRRARNRECARRSNERRRVHLQSLKDGLESESKKAAQLRKREVMLRRENLTLKAALAAHEPQQPQ